MDKEEINFAKLQLHTEIDFAYELISLGLSYLQKEKDPELRNYITAFLFCNGLERVLKTILILENFHRIKNNCSDLFKPKEISHNLYEMVLIITDLFSEDENYIRRRACLDDLNYLKNDSLFKEYLNHLSDFAKFGRYAFIDKAVGKNNSFDLREFNDNLDWMIVDQNPDLKDLVFKSFNDFSFFNRSRELMVQERQIIIEHVMCAISRMFTLTHLNSEGASFYGNIRKFLLLGEGRFGKEKY